MDDFFDSWLHAADDLGAPWSTLAPGVGAFGIIFLGKWLISRGVAWLRSESPQQSDLARRLQIAMQRGITGDGGWTFTRRFGAYPDGTGAAKFRDVAFNKHLNLAIHSGGHVYSDDVYLNPALSRSERRSVRKASRLMLALAREDAQKAKLESVKGELARKIGVFG